MSDSDMREACVKHVADAIAACYRRAWTSPDEMRGATGALKRLAVSMANLPLPPAPAASAPADDAVREALRGIKAMALCHHAHEDGAALLHALLVEIPAAIDDALTRTAAPADDAVARAREARAVAEAAFDKMTDAERAVLPLNVQEDARRRVSLAHIEAGEDAPAGQGTAVVSVPSKYTRLAWAMVSALNALAAERDAKGGEKEATQGTCSRCGYLAMPPACTKCYSPYPAPASRDGDAKGGSEGGERG